MFTSLDLKLAKFIYYNTEFLGYLNEEGMQKISKLVLTYQKEFDNGKTDKTFDAWLKLFNCYNHEL